MRGLLIFGVLIVGALAVAGLLAGATLPDFESGKARAYAIEEQARANSQYMKDQGWAVKQMAYNDQYRAHSERQHWERQDDTNQYKAETDRIAVRNEGWLYKGPFLLGAAVLFLVVGLVAVLIVPPMAIGFINGVGK